VFIFGRWDMESYELNCGKLEFEVHLRQQSEILSGQMYVYTDLDPTGELWAKDVNL
jgi:hypothetical protein